MFLCCLISMAIWDIVSWVWYSLTHNPTEENLFMGGVLFGNVMTIAVVLVFYLLSRGMEGAGVSE